MEDDAPEGAAGEQREEQREEESDRDERGRFVDGNPFRFPPGVSGNPSGRPLGVRRALARVMQRLREQVPGAATYERAGELALETLVKEMLRKDSRARVQAARDIADRDFGRTPIALKVGPDVDEGPREILIRVVGRGDVDPLALKRMTGGNGDGEGGNGTGGAGA